MTTADGSSDTIRAPSADVPPLHASEIRTFQRCPREWEFAYRMRRVPLLQPEALTRGTAVHRWLNAWWMGQQVLPDVLPVDPIARACCLGYAARYERPHLAHVRVEVPFLLTIEGVDCAGTVDAEGWDAGKLIVVEHKTTTADISPGSSYWSEVVTCSVQHSLYLEAYKGATILHDVIRKPALRKLRAGKPNEETDEELVARCLAAMAEEPEKYFARAMIVRLDSEREAFARDVRLVDELRRREEHPRNASSCFSFGRRCGYWDTCWGAVPITDDSVYAENMHGKASE